MVLAQDTDVLLLDEPTTSLDLHQLRVMETIERLNSERGVAVAVVLHDIAQAARFADSLDVEAAVTHTPGPEIVPERSP